jgi:protein required for attachment to host cells
LERLEMRQKKTWVATFDGARCRVFDYAGVPRRLQELTALSGARRPDFEDRPGAVFSSASPRRSAMTPQTDPERKLEDAFVEQVVEHLRSESSRKAFDEVIIVASPHALGAFRAAAPKALMNKVSKEITGDYVNGDEGRLLEAIAADA